MNISRFQKNNMAFSGKNYVAPSLRKLVPSIPEHEGYHISIAREHKSVPTTKSHEKIAINLINEKTGILDNVSIRNTPENLNNLPKIITENFHFRK